MSIHPLFAAPTRPALAPILFPDMPVHVRHLLPRTMDDLLGQRRDAEDFLFHAYCSSRVSYAAQDAQRRFSDRIQGCIDARIAQVVS